MRVLLVSAGSHGDINPFIAIGRALRERGHDARMMANPYFQGQIEEAGVGFVAMADEAEDLGAFIEQNPDVMHPREGPGVVIDLLVTLTARPTFERTVKLAETWRPDVVVHHHIVPSAAWGARQVGATSVAVVLSPMNWMSKGDVVAPMENSSPYPGAIMQWLMRLVGPMVIRRMLDKPLDRVRRELGLAKDMPLYWDVTRGGRLNLGMWSTHFRGRCEGDPEGGVICGFPWHDRHGEQEAVPGEVERFLEEGDAPILFTLGTAAVHVAGDFYAMAAEACRLIGRRGLLLVGPKRAGPTNMATGTRAFAYVPFSSVMPRCAVNVHHGGIGSTGQGMRAGRPTVVIPHAHDQFDNAARVKRLGISETIVRRKVTAEGLAQALKRVVADEGMTRRAREIGERLRGEDGAARAAEEIERIARG